MFITAKCLYILGVKSGWGIGGSYMGGVWGWWGWGMGEVGVGYGG